MKSLLFRRGSARDVSRLVTRPSDAILLIHIGTFATFVPLLLRLRLPIVARVLTPRRRHASADPGRVRIIEAMTNAVLGRRWIRRSCLVRGTTLFYFLTRAGLNVELLFGIGQVDGRFAGHCGLVKDGQPYLEMQDPRPIFTVVYSIPDDRLLAPPAPNTHRIAP